VKEHIEEEFVVVETNAVGDPGAMVIHFKDTAVALGAVVTSIGLGFVAPLANTNTSIALTFDRRRHTNYASLFFRGLVAGASLLLLRALWCSIQGSCRRIQVLEVLMDNFFWFTSLFLD